MRAAVAVFVHRSSRLDLQLLLGNQLLRLLGVVPALMGAAAVAFTVSSTLLRGAASPELAQVLPSWAVVAAYALTFFVAGDFSRFITHWLMHKVPALWAFHEVHHSAEVLTPLTFHRLHPLESLLYQLRSLLVTGGVTALFFWLFRTAAVDLTLLGVSALGLILNALTGNGELRPPDSYVETLFDSYAERFEHHLVGQLGYQLPALIRWLCDQQLELHPGRVLDLGCGTGLVGVRTKTVSPPTVRISSTMWESSRPPACWKTWKALVSSSRLTS